MNAAIIKRGKRYAVRLDLGRGPGGRRIYKWHSGYPTKRAAQQAPEPKTARGRRLIALDPGTIAALRAHRAQQAKERLALGPAWSAGELVFTPEDGQPLHPDWFRRRFQRRACRAGLPPIRFHDLRHTHATLALQAGVHSKVVSEQLGMPPWR